MAKEVGKETGLPIPRFVILKSNKSNIRKGPGMKYGIIWTYLRKGYPMEVIAEFENWRKLRDIDGTEGWINENLVTGRRNAIVIANKFSTKPNKYKSRLKAKEMVLFKHPDETSYPVVKAEFGVIASISKCGLEWCKIRVDKYSGWIRKENLWGVYKEEIIG
jgi:SH3-like domain-containing protein